jgi:hypothetical protein
LLEQVLGLRRQVLDSSGVLSEVALEVVQDVLRRGVKQLLEDGVEGQDDQLEMGLVLSRVGSDLSDQRDDDALGSTAGTSVEKSEDMLICETSIIIFK